MRLSELFEAFGAETAMSTLRSVANDYMFALRRAIDVLRDKTEEGDPRTGQRMVGGIKAKWITDNFFSGGRHSKHGGLEPAVRELAKRAKNPKAQALFKRLASVFMSANKESGRAQTFDEIGDIFSQLANATTDRELAQKFERIAKLRRQLSAIRAQEQPSEPSRREKSPRSDLGGQQQQQAEQAFQAALSSLPAELQGQVRRETQRMDPSKKLRYLRKFMS